MLGVDFNSKKESTESDENSCRKLGLKIAFYRCYSSCLTAARTEKKAKFAKFFATQPIPIALKTRFSALEESVPFTKTFFSSKSDKNSCLHNHFSNGNHSEKQIYTAQAALRRASKTSQLLTVPSE